MKDSFNRIRVVVADDHPMYRYGVVRALKSTGYVEVVGEADDGRTALELIRDLQPDVAVVDYRLPDLDGAAVAHALRRDGSPTKVLLISAYDDAEIVYRSLQEGAVGYLPKESSLADILAAVQSSARGDAVISERLAGGLVRQIQQRRADDAPFLTERELEVLRFVAQGKSAPAMAKELVLSEATIKTYLRRLYEKLGVSDRGAAVAEAMRRRLIE